MAIIKDGNVLGQNSATVAAGKGLSSIYAAYPNKYYYGGTTLTVLGKMDAAELTALKAIFTADTAVLDALYLTSQNYIRQFNSIQLQSGVAVNHILTDVTLASASNNDLATALAIKTYVANNAGTVMFRENAQVVTTNYTVVSTLNASTVGPISIASGVTVTVSGTWVIL